VSARTVGRLLGGALDAGLNAIDTAECYEDSEILIGKAIGARRRSSTCSPSAATPVAGTRGLAAGSAARQHRAQPAAAGHRLRRPHPAPQLLARPSPQGRGDRGLEQARERGWARYIGYSGDGAAARYAVECGRFDTLQTSISVADQEAIELTLPLAVARQMGVIAKRPIANVAWRYERKPPSRTTRPTGRACGRSTIGS